MPGRKNSFVPMRTGSSQTNRNNQLLDTENIKIDDRSMADHIAFAYELAEQVRFYNLKNKVSGNWQPFFGSDECILLARISILNTQEIDSDFQSLLSEFEKEVDPDQKESLFVDLFNNVRDLALILNNCYATSLAYNLTGEGTNLSVHVQNIVEYKLKGVFNELVGLEGEFNSLFSNTGLNLQLEKFDRIWKESESTEEKTELFTGSDPKDKLISASKHLTLIFKEILRAVTYIVKITPRLLENSINEDQNHAPQNALFITFLKLYEYVSEDLNEITTKHLNYYFFNVLEQQYKPPRPDNVYLYFSLADQTENYLLKEGTLFEAGTDEEGVSYLYQADQDVILNRAVVSDVKLLYVAKNNLASSDDDEIGNQNKKYGKDFKEVFNIYQAEIASSESGAIDFESQPVTFPTFGQEQSSPNSDILNMIPSELGFAISSPVLVLNEGIRTLQIDLKFDLKSMSSLVSSIENYALNENMSAEGAFHKIFVDSFDISISTLEGWYTIGNYNVSPPKDWSEGLMRITFTLNQSAPGLATMEPGVEDLSGYDTNWPIVRFLMSAKESMYTYSYLSELRLDSCEINVKVEKLKNLKLFNNLGKLDPGSPFFPFGSVPALGSYLLVGHDELYKKKVTDISLDLTWHNLPRMDGGFKEYYDRYNQDIDNSSFGVSLQALSGYEFLPKEDGIAQTFELFKTAKVVKGETPHEKINTNTSIDKIDVEKLLIRPDYNHEELVDYDNTVKSGYLKMELTTPDIGFGHDLYPTLFASEVVESANSSKKALNLPNTPYIPQLRSMEMSYEATTKIMMSRTTSRGSDPEAKEKFYHVEPFGIRTVFSEAVPLENHLVPQYNGDGYLILGLQHFKGGQTLTLYFNLEQDIGNDFEVELPQVSWQFLSNNQWVTLSDKDVIFDGTNGFTVSGIVSLNIPKTITDDNDVLTKGKIWISAKVMGDVSLLSKTKGIFTQAVSATWIPHKEQAEWFEEVPPYTIGRLATPRPEIANVVQPASSFFGRRRETLSKFYLRISERLRHKQRAVTSWDYEHLILEKYPFIEKIKCLTNMDHDHIKSGAVWLVIIPEIKRDKSFYAPKLNYDTLGFLQRYVDGLSSPFSTVSVINPVYEKVKVTASILFVDNSMKGEYIRLLNEEIKRLICPWFYNEKTEMNFGGSVRKDDVLALIESREYVRYVTKMSVVIVHNMADTFSISDSAGEEGNALELYASKPWSVLVPMESHQFSVIDKQKYETPEITAIEKMRLGEDFILTQKTEDDSYNEDFPKYDSSGEEDYYTVEFDL